MEPAYSREILIHHRTNVVICEKRSARKTYDFPINKRALARLLSRSEGVVGLNFSYGP